MNKTYIKDAASVLKNADAHDHAANANIYHTWASTEDSLVFGEPHKAWGQREPVTLT